MLLALPEPLLIEDSLVCQNAKDIVADAGTHLDPQASKRLKEDVYVDDRLSGGTVDQVNRFVGFKNDDTGS